ncbi:MAG: hypothetical protein GYB31_00425 [Bacteroidetes bacterium]|nr:hypothetical protein [Bacteroidota bacterium]
MIRVLFFLGVFAFSLFSCLPNSKAQNKIVQLDRNPIELIQLADTVTIGAMPIGYTAFYPDGPLKGAVVFFQADWEGKEPIVAEANKRQLAVIYISSGNKLEFFLEEEEMLRSEEILIKALDSLNLDESRLLFAGMSLAGTRAVRMAEFANTYASKYRIVPRAVAICDSPLDMIRFWKSADKAARTQYNEIGAAEGYWVSKYLSNNLGGIPKEIPQEYWQVSAYCQDAPGFGQAQYFPKSTAVRAYTEPDVLWWMQERGKDYYDMNAIDAAAFINYLQLLDHQEAQLILTEEKGIRQDGSRHPHSWSIVNIPDLLDWFDHL